MTARKRTTRKNPEQEALKSLAAGAAALLAQTEYPIPAKKLEPLMKAVLQLGDTVVNRMADEAAERFADTLAEKIADRIDDKLAGKVAEIRFPKK